MSIPSLNMAIIFLSILAEGERWSQYIYDLFFFFNHHEGIFGQKESDSTKDYSKVWFSSDLEIVIQ